MKKKNIRKKEMQGGEFFDQKKGTTAKSVFSRKTQIRTQA